VRITSPSGESSAGAAEVRDVENGAYNAILDVFDLPEDGEYLVRSDRADFPHPAPRVTALLRAQQHRVDGPYMRPCH